MQAYGLIDSGDILDKLLGLNRELAEKEKRGEPVVGPDTPNWVELLMSVIIIFVTLGTIA